MKKLIIPFLLCLFSLNVSAQELSLIKDELNHEKIVVSSKFADISYTKMQFSATILPEDTVYALHVRISGKMPYVTPGASVRLNFEEGSKDLRVLTVKSHEETKDFDLTIPFNQTRIVEGEGLGEYSEKIKTKEIQNPESFCDEVYLCCPMNASVLQAFRTWNLDSIELETVRAKRKIKLENDMIPSLSGKRMHKIADDFINFCRNLK